MDYKKNYYKILGISVHADQREVKRAYRSLALKYHPDRVAQEEKEQSEVKFRDIVEAYYVLCDESKRNVYDQYVGADSIRYTQKSDFRKKAKETGRYSQHEIEEILRKHYEGKGFTNYAHREWKNYSKDPFRFYRPEWESIQFGLGKKGKISAFIFGIFFIFIHSLLNVQFRPFDLVVLAGILYIFFESKLDYKYSDFKGLIVITIWFLFLISSLMMLAWV